MVTCTPCIQHFRTSFPTRSGLSTTFIWVYLLLTLAFSHIAQTRDNCSCTPPPPPVAALVVPKAAPFANLCQFHTSHCLICFYSISRDVLNTNEILCLATFGTVFNTNSWNGESGIMEYGVKWGKYPAALAVHMCCLVDPPKLKPLLSLE